MRKEAIVNARIPGMKPNHVGCADCGLRMKECITPKLFAVDHIVTASEPASAILDYNDFFKRLNVSAKDGLQILCNPCHAVKTAAENVLRVKPKKKRRKLTRRTTNG